MPRKPRTAKPSFGDQFTHELHSLRDAAQVEAALAVLQHPHVRDLSVAGFFKNMRADHALWAVMADLPIATVAEVLTATAPRRPGRPPKKRRQPNLLRTQLTKGQLLGLEDAVLLLLQVWQAGLSREEIAERIPLATLLGLGLLRSGLHDRLRQPLYTLQERGLVAISGRRPLLRYVAVEPPEHAHA